MEDDSVLLRRRRRPTYNASHGQEQAALVEKVFGIMRASSADFTQDRLFYLAGEDYAMWTDDCTEILRQRIEGAAPATIQIRLRYFRMAVGCLSLECLPAQIAA
jgi:hypothetical protein